MRVTQTFAAFALPYDRPHDIFEGSFTTGEMPPHMLTERLSLYVPWDYKVWLMSVMLRIRRTSVPTIPGRCYIRVMYTYANEDPRDLAYISYGGTSLLDERYINLTNIGFFDGGDTIRVYTYDDSTGGQVEYSASLRGIKFS